MSKSIVALVFAAAAALAAPAVSAAPIVAQENGFATWATDSGGIGQTFLWPSNAQLGVARVVAGEAPFTATFKLYNGAHLCNDSGGEFYSQTGIALALDVYTSFVLTTPQPLVNGSTYTFCVYNVTKGRLVLHYTSLYDFYANGVYVSDNTFDPAAGGGDLQFELDGPLPGAAALAAAPAVTSGFLALLALLLLAVGATVQRRRT